LASAAGGVSLEFDNHTFTPTIPKATPSPTNGKAKADIFIRPDLPELALDGRLGEIYQRRMSQYPRAYAWPALLAAAGVLIPRTDNQTIRPNLYVALVGAKGTGKSDTFEHVFSLLGLEEPVLLRGLFGSSEGLFDRLNDTPDAVRLLYPDELTHLLTKASLEKSSFPTTLSTAYYRDKFIGGSKGKPFNFDCRLSVAGGLPEDRFDEAFGSTTSGGLHDRFCFGLVPQPYQLLWRPFQGSREPLLPVPPEVAPECWDCRDALVKHGMPSRVAEQVLKVAYIAAAADGRRFLRGCELGPALQFGEYQTKLRTLLTPSEGLNQDAKCAEKILRWLRDKAPNGDWVRRRDLSLGINANRFGPSVFNRCLLQLQFNDDIELDEPARTVRLT
jgi:hypothetical protein